MKIGVIGIGTVGYPLFKALDYYHKEVVCYDPHKESNEWKDIIDCNTIFICVPTDSGKDGRLKMDVVDSVLDRLEGDFKGLAVIKSTLGLGYIDNAIDNYLFDIAVFPEWLREKMSFQDTLKPDLTVIGTENHKFVDIILEACPWHKYEGEENKLFVVKPEEAVMIKLTANALASTKISFTNQILLICEEYDLDVHKVMKAIRNDPRCAPRYLDPTMGAYGGYCLPKDTLELAESIKDADLLKAVHELNEIIKEKFK